MEFASYLAGERWSDHPSCTHPLLASMARQVNDVVSDSYRPQLAELVPTVIGVNDDDPHLDAIIARRAAVTALPVAAAWRQRVLAVALLSAERVLAEFDGRPVDSVSELAKGALAHAPDAEKWARSFSTGADVTPRAFRRHAAPTAVRCSVEGIAQACISGTDRMLHDLLAQSVQDCREWSDLRAHRTPDAARWEEACKLTGVSPS